MNTNRGIYLRILLYNSSVKIKRCYFYKICRRAKLREHSLPWPKIWSLLPQIVSDLTCGQKKKWQKRAEVVVNLKYELSLLLLSLHPSIWDLMYKNIRIKCRRQHIACEPVVTRILEISNFKLKWISSTKGTRYW